MTRRRSGLSAALLLALWAVLAQSWVPVLHNLLPHGHGARAFGLVLAPGIEKASTAAAHRHGEHGDPADGKPSPGKADPCPSMHSLAAGIGLVALAPALAPPVEFEARRRLLRLRGLSVGSCRPHDAEARAPPAIV